MPRPRVIVVGAGLGGLAAAARLAALGYHVTVVERHDVPGGRAGLWESRGFSFDTGPSMVMMLECWHRLFADLGRRIEDYLTLVKCDPNYRLTFADGSTLEMTTRLDQLFKNIEAMEPGCTPRARAFLKHTGELYRRGVPFISRNMNRVTSMLGAGRLGLRFGLSALGDLQRLVRKYVRDPRLQQALTFQTLYLGVSPYKALGVYGLLPFAELNGGIHYPVGGVHQLARALERLGAEFGATYQYGVAVTRLEKQGRAVTRVELADGRHLEADLVVCNADLPYAHAALLGEPHPRSERFVYGNSAVLLCLGLDRTYPNLLHHNLVMPTDLEGACRQIFSEHRVPDEPPLYVVASTRTDPGQAPPGCENVFVLVPAPSQDPARPIDWSVEGPLVEARTLARLDATLMPGLRAHIVTSRRTTPDDFTARFGNLRGEAFGLSHNFGQVGYFRPHNRHARYRNLYFVGQSTQPGCGVPMVLISAELVTQRIRAEQPVRA